MILLAGFAFLAGVVTILSPCILPLLPIILSSSVTGSKKRPVGVVLGFVLSFTFFTLFLSAIVRATNLSADALRTLSVVILIAFGASLLFPRFQQWMERLFTKLSSVAPQRQGSGLSGGILVGVSLGLIWTPCVGPILASVISLALTGSVSGAAVIITLAYALGTGLPMLAIMFGGRALLQKAPWLMRNTGKIQKAFGILMIITAIGIFYNVDRTFQSYILDKFPNYGVGLTSFEDNEAVKENLQSLDSETDENDIGKPMDELMGDKFMEAPELIPGGEWFNSEPLTLS
ncbi:MAG: cytochrome c biogenesis CcdA family protein, partial [bacterium]|nr:cytochrome c biogenesis CcdA family protein [bacterium]